MQNAYAIIHMAEIAFGLGVCGMMPLFDLTPLLTFFDSLLLGFLAMFLLGLIVGLLGSMFGIGGGILVTPILHSGIGMSASHAVATSIGQIPLVSLSGLLKYWKEKKIDYALAWALLLTSVPSAQVVAHLLGTLHQSMNEPIVFGQTAEDLLVAGTFFIVLGGIGLYNWRLAGWYERNDQQNLGAAPARSKCLIAAAITGILFGVFSALLGIGGGLFSVPFFTYYCRKTPIEAVATSLFALFVTSVLTTVHYVMLGQVFFGVSLSIAFGGIIGAALGSHWAIRLRPPVLLRGFATLQWSASLMYLVSRLLIRSA